MGYCIGARVVAPWWHRVRLAAPAAVGFLAAKASTRQDQQCYEKWYLEIMFELFFGALTQYRLRMRDRLAPPLLGRLCLVSEASSNCQFLH